MIALTDDPTIASNVLLMVISTCIVLLSIVRVYIKNMHYVLDIVSNISLIAIGFLVREFANHNRLDAAINRAGVMAMLGCNVAIFVGIIMYHFYKYIIIVRCRKKIAHHIYDEESNTKFRESLLENNDCRLK